MRSQYFKITGYEIMWLYQPIKPSDKPLQNATLQVEIPNNFYFDMKFSYILRRKIDNQNIA